ncbi:hypothetical protein [Candidatus Electronema sp. JC]|uniref:hypothetical protein n=1 Tax=Candidatus Electronema sp. JC TaxID=3401570 RepID=UPI003B43B5CD
MAVTGKWTLFYDWHCDGSYSSVTMDIKADGTWSDGHYNGLWVQVTGMFMFTFNNSETTYSGNLASKSITGIMTTFSGLQGCFYMLREGVPVSFAVRQISEKADSAGK